MKTISELLSDIENKELILPEFQRGFVWKPPKVKAYVESIYRNYPTGHFLIWKTFKLQEYRGDTHDYGNNHHNLILDGQQRLTSLFTVFRGEPPPFFEGKDLYFRIYFNVLTEEFDFWQPVKMRDKPEWIEVTPFLIKGVGNFFESAELTEEQKFFYFNQLRYLNKLDQIRNYSYELETIPKGGYEMETDEVVRIFNLVNSQGEALSKGDLALAHMCASWPEARASLKETHEKFKEIGFDLKTQKNRALEFWVRALALIATGSVLLDGSFYKTNIEIIKEAWPKLEKSTEYLVNVLRNDAYIDSSQNLTTPYVVLPIIKYLSSHGYSFDSEIEKQRFLYWFYAAQMWARYSGQLDSELQKDINSLEAEDVFEALRSNLLSRVGRIIVQPKDLYRKTRINPLFNIIYVVACSKGAIDWFTGIGLYTKNVGAQYSIQHHHIFPESRLYKEGGFNSKDRKDIYKVNEIANLAFLTQKANLKASNNLPSVYLPQVLEKYPSALKGQFVPEDPRLWEIENYDAFLEERRKLLADGINEFMQGLLEVNKRSEADPRDIASIIRGGESAKVEFKSSMRWDRQLLKVNKAIEMAILKTIAGFLNTDGGILLIGVDNDGLIVGIEDDNKTLRNADRDSHQLHLIQLVSGNIGKERCINIRISYHDLDGKDVCMVQVDHSPKPAYLKEENDSKFYIRTGNLTQPLSVQESHEYIQNNFQI